MLQTVGNVSRQEPSVVISQIVVDCITFGDGTVGLDCVQVVVGGGNTQLSFEQTGSNEHQRRGHDHFAGLGCDQQATFIRPSSDLDNGGFQGSLVKVSASGRTVAVGTTGHQRVRSGEQNLTVTVGRVARAGEALVQDSCSLDLLGISHTTGQCFGVASRQTVVQVVFHGLFGQGEAHSNGLVRIARRPSFLSVVVNHGRTLVFHGGGAKAGQLGFFFKGTLGGFSFENLFVFFAVCSVLKAEQGVEAREQFLEELSA